MSPVEPRARDSILETVARDGHRREDSKAEPRAQSATSDEIVVDVGDKLAGLWSDGKNREEADRRTNDISRGAHRTGA